MSSIDDDCSGGGSRSRPSRPSSLPCLPEEKMAYYQHPSYSSTASAGSTSLLASAAASAASTVAQAAAMPHRPHSFYPPIQQLEEDDCDEDDEDVLVSMVPVSSSTQHHHHQPHQRGRQGQRKLNLALHRYVHFHCEFYCYKSGTKTLLLHKLGTGGVLRNGGHLSYLINRKMADVRQTMRK